MMEYCFLNGEIMPLKEAKIGIEDIGLLRGYGIYDGLAVINGKVFHFEDHWNRFVSGARFLNLNIPYAPEVVEKKIEELAIKNGCVGDVCNRGNVRLILTGGRTIAGIEYEFANPTFYIIVEKFVSLPKNYYENGAALITVDFLREFPEYKTTNYIRGVSLQDHRKQEGAVEVLYTKDGEVYECATSNIFMVKDNTIITPSDEVLYGITRKVVLDLAKDKYKVEERRVYTKELYEADEVFITSSFKDIVPIVKIDDSVVGGGAIGRVTEELMGGFAQLLK